MPDRNNEPSSTQTRSTSDRADGFESRNRNTETVDQIFKATGGPAVFIANLLKTHTALDVLEVGFGWGIALLELAWRFRDVSVVFHGVDIEEKAALSTPEGILAFAREQGVIPGGVLSDFKIPQLSFYDAARLEFDAASLDFVYSAVTIRFMRDKIGFIEEVARVLRPGGQALLHIGESNWNYPYGKRSAAPVLTPFTSRIVLTYEDELIPLPNYFQLFAGAGFEFAFTEQARCILILTKRASGELDLGLKLNDELTLPGRKVPLVNRKGETRGGIRSVYTVRPENYQAMVRRGLLSPHTPTNT